MEFTVNQKGLINFNKWSLRVFCGQRILQLMHMEVLRRRNKTRIILVSYYWTTINSVPVNHHAAKRGTSRLDERLIRLVGEYDATKVLDFLKSVAHNFEIFV